jgi:hypothetical protein
MMGWANRPTPWTKVEYGQQPYSPWYYYASGVTTSTTFHTKLEIPAANNPSEKTWWAEIRYTSTVGPWTPSVVQPYPVYHTGTTTMDPLSTVGLGVHVASQPALFNSAVTVDDSDTEVANTSNMIVTNVQYAWAAATIGIDETTLDNPVVQGLFAASPDPVRPGPFVVAPGETLALSNMPPSMQTADTSGGTLLMKCDVQNSDGQPVPFVMQFDAVDAPPTPTPASSWWSVLALLACGIAVAASGKRARSLFGLR